MTKSVFHSSATLYGDGEHDDRRAIQALLDTRSPVVVLPPPQVHYQIGGPLVLHSNQELRLDRFTLIRLAPQSNCPMLINDDPVQGNCDIAIVKGDFQLRLHRVIHKYSLLKYHHRNYFLHILKIILPCARQVVIL